MWRDPAGAARRIRADRQSRLASLLRRAHNATVPPTETEQARWFAQEVHPHEPSLRAYLRGAFPSVRDIDDVVQESLLRTWRARAGQPIRSARAFLFLVARRVALDLVRRDHVAPVIALRDLEALPVIQEGAGAPDAVSAREKILLLADAIDALPARCREILILRKLHSVSQRETAARLGIAEKTVEAHLARGLARCEDYLRRRGVRSWYDHE